MPARTDDRPSGLSPAAGRAALVAAFAAVLALAVALAWLAFAPVHERLAPRDPNAALGQLAGKTPEEVQAELDRIVEEGVFNISIAPAVYFADAGAAGDVRIENVPGNRYDMRVSIALDGTGELVYESGVIEPNHHVQTARLSARLVAGAHPATAVFTALDPVTGDEAGRASAKITLVVES